MVQTLRILKGINDYGDCLEYFWSVLNGLLNMLIKTLLVSAVKFTTYSGY